MGCAILLKLAFQHEVTRHWYITEPIDYNIPISKCVYGILPQYFKFIFLLRLFTLPQSRTYTPRDLQAKCLYGEQESLDRNTRQIHKAGPPWMCGQHNVRASAEDNTGQSTDKGHKPNPWTEIKIPDPAGNRTRGAGLEGRDSRTTPRRRIILQICANEF